MLLKPTLEMDNNVNIDSSEFKVDAYMRAIMKDYSLNRLLEKENELTKEIKLLDNDMQSLVYENYNKFINATDIVQNLKENFVTMETLLKDLSANMEKISQSNYAMSNELKPKKDRISNLVGINNTLQKLQFLFDLPTNLNDLINQKLYMEALRQFSNASNIFHKHKKLKTFADIYTECQIIMKDLYSELLELAYENKTKDEPNLYGIFEVLSGLENAGITCVNVVASRNNVSSLSSLKEHFLEIMDKKLREETDNLIETYDNSNESNPKAKEYMRFADEACDGFLKSLASYITYYRLLFLLPPNLNELNTLDRESGKRLIAVTQAVFTHFMDRALKPFYCTGSVLAPSEILVVRSLDKICQKVKDLSESTGQQLFDQRPPPQIAIRRNVAEPFGRNNELVSTKSRPFDFDQMFTHNFLLPAVKCRIIAHQEVCCHNLVKLVLNVKHKLAKLPPGIAAENVNYLGEINKNFITTLGENLKNTMNKLTCYTSTEDATFANDPKFIETFGKSFIFGNFIFPFYRHLADVFEKLQSKQTEDNLGKDTSQASISNAGDGLKDNSVSMAQLSSPLALLLFSRVAYDFCTTTYDELITFAYQTFSQKRYVGGTSLKSLPKGDEIKGIAASGIIFDIVPKSDFKGAATRLVNAYVLRQGFTVSQLIQKSVQTRDWLRTLEPRNVRAAMKRVVEELTLTDAQVGQIYEEGVKKLNTSSDSSRRAANSQFRHSQSSLGIGRMAKALYPTAPGTTTNNTYHSPNTTIQRANILNSHIYKLFSEKIVIYETVDLNKISIMTGIVKICLKTFLESIRLKTLSTYGFQQIQVDVNYLQLYLWRFVSSEKILQTLLDEILSTAALRCTNPVLMEQSVIDVICER